MSAPSPDNIRKYWKRRVAKLAPAAKRADKLSKQRADAAELVRTALARTSKRTKLFRLLTEALGHLEDPAALSSLDSLFKQTYNRKYLEQFITRPTALLASIRKVKR